MLIITQHFMEWVKRNSTSSLLRLLSLRYFSGMYQTTQPIYQMIYINYLFIKQPTLTIKKKRENQTKKQKKNTAKQLLSAFFFSLNTHLSKQEWRHTDQYRDVILYAELIFRSRPLWATTTSPTPLVFSWGVLGFEKYRVFPAQSVLTV